MSRPITANALDAPARGWQAAGRADVERLFRSAGRHSRIVRVMRIAVPVVAMFGIGAYIVFTYFNPIMMLDKLPNVSGKLTMQGKNITMELPRIAGITRDQRSYEVTAETAVQDLTRPGFVELQNLHTRMELKDGDVVVVTAKSGTYNTKADKVTLREHVLVTTAQGYNVKMHQAEVDMKKGHVATQQPVEVKMPTGRIFANGMEMVDSGEVIRFTQGVVMHLDAGEPAEEAKQ